MPSAVSSRRWPALVTIVFLTGVGGGLLWLLVGIVAVRGYRTRSGPVEDASLLELVDVLRAELGCRRRIEVRQSNELVTAAVIGWRRPLLLLPEEWTNWTDAQRRAVLAHEIAHGSRPRFSWPACSAWSGSCCTSTTRWFIG